MFSKACEYGIRATLFIAQQSHEGRRVSLKEIAREIDSPVAFTAKILQVLARESVVHSLKGPTGGFEIPPEQMEKVKLSHIVSAIDGDKIYRGCALGLSQCDETRPCPVHDEFVAIRDNLQHMLENTNVFQLMHGLKDGTAFLKR